MKGKHYMLNILNIPDTQSKLGVPVDHLYALSEFIVHRKPDVIVHMGDHWDLPSLSVYDRGKLDMGGHHCIE